MNDATRRLPATAILAGLLLLQGCSALPGNRVGLANPAPLHQSGRAPSMMKPDDIEQKALDAYRYLPLRYYEALEKAKAPDAKKEDIDAYVKAGTALVELDCLRWFGRIADAQRGLTYQDANWNVIRQLGTTLIGIAKLHPDVTTVYGAGNTAWEGFRNNVNNMFLAAPSAESVKKLTFEALGKRIDLLNDEKAPIHPRDFGRAYLEIEKLADICTYSEIKKLTTQAVVEGQTTANPKTGEISIVPSTRVESTFLKDDAGDRLRKFWKPDGTNIDAGNQKKLLEWMDNNDLGPIPVLFFLRSSKFAAERRQAAGELLP